MDAERKKEESKGSNDCKSDKEKMRNASPVIAFAQQPHEKHQRIIECYLLVSYGHHKKERADAVIIFFDTEERKENETQTNRVVLKMAMID